MQRRINILLPQAESWESIKGKIVQKGLDDVRDKIITFIDDGRPNADVAIGKIKDMLVEKYKVRPIVIEKRRLGIRAHQPLPKDLFERLVQETQAAIVGLASWGSCTSRSVRDAADFEEQGIPSAVIAVPAFVGHAKNYAKSLGLPEEKIVVLPLGMAWSDSEEAIPLIKEGVEKVLPNLMAALRQVMAVGVT